MTNNDIAWKALIEIKREIAFCHHKKQNTYDAFKNIAVIIDNLNTELEKVVMTQTDRELMAEQDKYYGFICDNVGHIDCDCAHPDDCKCEECDEESE